jgi:hypothetical protein
MDGALQVCISTHNITRRAAYSEAVLSPMNQSHSITYYRRMNSVDVAPSLASAVVTSRAVAISLPWYSMYRVSDSWD